MYSNPYRNDVFKSHFLWYFHKYLQSVELRTLLAILWVSELMNNRIMVNGNHKCPETNVNWRKLDVYTEAGANRENRHFDTSIRSKYCNHNVLIRLLSSPLWKLCKSPLSFLRSCACTVSTIFVERGQATNVYHCSRVTCRCDIYMEVPGVRKKRMRF